MVRWRPLYACAIYLLTHSQPRLSFKAEVAEFFGAFTIILFGAGAQCQAQLYPSAGGVSGDKDKRATRADLAVAPPSTLPACW